MTILLTRPSEDYAQSAAAYAAAGFKVQSAPLFTIEPCPVPDWPTDITALIITSARVVRFLPPAPFWRALPCFALAPKTRKALERAGFQQIVSTMGGAPDLLPLIHTAGISGRMLHLTGWHRAFDFAQAGLNVTHLPLYKAPAVTALPNSAIKAIGAGMISHISFYSPRAARLWDRLVPPDIKPLQKSLTALCLSQNIATELRDTDWHSILIAQEPHEAAMIEAVTQARDQR